MDATDLTQLSSREQLSALMDGALPADETRFLLRRLQHDESMAECWERWRLSADVMRGLAPAQRLPADFALRVSASLRGDDTVGKVVTGKQASGAPAWLRWGGGAAMAASLAVVAMMTRPVTVEAPAAAAVAVMDAASPAANQMPVPNMPSRDPAGLPDGSSIESQAAALATAIAAAARPARSNARNRGQSQSAQPATIRMQDPAVEVAANDVLSSMLPQADIVARPWPRSVLPNYGNSGITVGFDDSARNAAPYNPFQVRRSIGNLPPSLIVDTPAPDVATPANDETGPAANNEPQS